MSSQYDAAIQLLIKAQDETGPAFASVSSNLGKTSQAVKGLSAVTSIFSGLAIGGAVQMLSSFGQAAHDREESLARLANAVDQNGGRWAANRREIEKAIEANRRYAFSDKDVMDSISLLTVESGSYEAALRREKVAMDLSRATGMDLYTASRLLGKVTDENINVLKRWGIEVEKGSSAEQLLAEVEKRTGGAAERYAETRAAATDRMRNSFTELKASAGETLGPLASIAQISSSLPAVLGAAGGALAFFTGRTKDGAVGASAFSSLLSKIGGALPIVAKGLGAAGLLMGEFFGIIEGAAALGRAGVPFLDKFSNKQGDGSLDLFMKIMEKRGFVGALGLLKDEILGTGEKSSEAAKRLDELKGKVVALNDIYGKNIEGGSGKGAPGGLASAAGAIASLNKDIAESLNLAADDPVLKKFSDVLNNIAGASPSAAMKEVGDQLFKRVHDKLQAELVEPIQKIMDEISADKSGAALKKYAAEAGKTPAQYKKDLAKQLKDAQAMEETLEAELAAKIAEGQTQATAAIKTFHDEQRQRIQDEKMAVLDLREEYGRLNAARAGGNAAIIAHNTGDAGALRDALNPYHGTSLSDSGGSGGFIAIAGRALGGPMRSGNVYMVGEQNRREAIVMGVGSDRSRDQTGGGLTIAPGAFVIHAAGADASAGARIAAQVIDDITEAYRQQNRRIGFRASPFGSMS